MTSNQMILADLRLIMDAAQPVELFSTYKGVPTICIGQIEAIDGDLVQIKTNDPTIICLKYSQQARVLGSDYFEPALAQIIDLNIPDGRVKLSEFSYVGTKLGERMIVRVEPKETISVNLVSESQAITGNMADISMSGIGVWVSHYSYSPILRPGTSLKLKLHLPNGSISTSGIVLSVTKMPEVYRISIRFTQSGPEKATIFRYLIDRRAEIEQEILEKYNTCLKTEVATEH